MKYATCTFLFVTVLTISLFAQQTRSLADVLHQNYEEYKEKNLESRHFKHEDILPLIGKLRDDSLFSVRRVGHSVDERSIHLVSVGEGDIDLLFWSQMHGDEPTATAAIFDLLHFFQNRGTSLDNFKRVLLSKVTLHFLPMLNPDGAEDFKRRNALGIDINRDARRLTSPESNILKQVRDSLNPAFGFNLHDQSTYYTAGGNGNPATISFLAPPYDYNQSINETRGNAMKLIVYLNTILQEYIPDQIGKFSGSFEPRAFGDMFQKWGTSTVLIESGGYQGDPEKQYVRKLNFILFISAADAVARRLYRNQSIENYHAIPQNLTSLHDILIRKIDIVKEGRTYNVDLAIRFGEQNGGDSGDFSYRSRIADIGDLTYFHGYREIEGDGLTAEPGKIYPDTIETESELQQLNASTLLNRGYTDVVLRGKQLETKIKELQNNIPLNLVLKKSHSNKIRVGEIPNLLLKEGGNIRYVIVNGFIYETGNGARDISSIKNSVIYR